jgi:hypothetical protein
MIVCKCMSSLDKLVTVTAVFTLLIGTHSLFVLLQKQEKVNSSWEICAFAKCFKRDTCHSTVCS